MEESSGDGGIESFWAIPDEAGKGDRVAFLILEPAGCTVGEEEFPEQSGQVVRRAGLGGAFEAERRFGPAPVLRGCAQASCRPWLFQQDWRRKPVSALCRPLAVSCNRVELSAPERNGVS